MLPDRLQEFLARRRLLGQLSLEFQLVRLEFRIDDLLLVDGLKLLEVLVHLGLQVEGVDRVLDHLVSFVWLVRPLI